MPDFQPPAYALREMPDDLPADPLGREIALLMHEHPDRFVGFSIADLAGWDDNTKAILLGDIKEMLGIRPIRTRRLGHVGPEGDEPTL